MGSLVTSRKLQMVIRAGNTLQPTLHFMDGASEAQLQINFPKIISLLVEKLKERIQVHLFLAHYFSTTISCLPEATKRVY